MRVVGVGRRGPTRTVAATAWGARPMLLAEEYATSHGARSLGLSVFGFNEVARALYESLGYATTSVKMAKALRPLGDSSAELGARVVARAATWAPDSGVVQSSGGGSSWGGARTAGGAERTPHLLALLGQEHAPAAGRCAGDGTARRARRCGRRRRRRRGRSRAGRSGPARAWRRRGRARRSRPR